MSTKLTVFRVAVGLRGSEGLSWKEGVLIEVVILLSFAEEEAEEVAVSETVDFFGTGGGGE